MVWAHKSLIPKISNFFPKKYKKATIKNKFLFPFLNFKSIFINYLFLDNNVWPFKEVFGRFFIYFNLILLYLNIYKLLFKLKLSSRYAMLVFNAIVNHNFDDFDLNLLSSPLFSLVSLKVVNIFRFLDIIFFLFY